MCALNMENVVIDYNTLPSTTHSHTFSFLLPSSCRLVVVVNRPVVDLSAAARRFCPSFARGACCCCHHHRQTFHRDNEIENEEEDAAADEEDVVV